MGIVASTFAESFPPEATFSVDDIPDLEGKIVIILLSRNAKVYMATRNAEKARAAIADLRAQTGKDAIFLELDLGDLKSVKTAATNFLA
ncbi:hypothetical protein C0991_010293 [Blastosporella zonata]|nr:hypothetical protein C0991_010293 [Blastosporella zonata]